MNKRSITIILRQRRVDVLLASRIRPEVDGATWGHPHQVRAKPFEESGHSLVGEDVPGMEIRIKKRKKRNEHCITTLIPIETFNKDEQFSYGDLW